MTAVGVLVDLWRAFVTVKLYNWFALPLFGGPSIPVLSMLGLIFLFSVFKGYGAGNLSERDDSEVYVRTILNSLFCPLILLIVGAIVR